MIARLFFIESIVQDFGPFPEEIDFEKDQYSPYEREYNGKPQKSQTDIKADPYKDTGNDEDAAYHEKPQTADKQVCQKTKTEPSESAFTGSHNHTSQLLYYTKFN